MLYFALITLLIAKKYAISRQSSASSTRPVAAKQPGPKPDYRIWGLMQQCLYKTPVRDTIDSEKRLVDTWASISQCVIDETVDQ